MMINIQKFMLTFVEISNEYTINAIKFNIIILYLNFTDPADVSILDLSMEIEELSSMKDNIREILVIIKYTDSLKSDNWSLSTLVFNIFKNIE